MRDFNYYAPTEVAFGKDSEEQVAIVGPVYDEGEPEPIRALRRERDGRTQRLHRS